MYLIYVFKNVVMILQSIKHKQKHYCLFALQSAITSCLFVQINKNINLNLSIKKIINTHMQR